MRLMDFMPCCSCVCVCVIQLEHCMRGWQSVTLLYSLYPHISVSDRAPQVRVPGLTLVWRCSASSSQVSSLCVELSPSKQASVLYCCLWHQPIRLKGPDSSAQLSECRDSPGVALCDRLDQAIIKTTYGRLSGDITVPGGDEGGEDPAKLPFGAK